MAASITRLQANLELQQERIARLPEAGNGSMGHPQEEWQDEENGKQIQPFPSPNTQNLRRYKMCPSGVSVVSIYTKSKYQNGNVRSVT